MLELLEENTRLQHERRGLQYRGEKDRNHLMARVHELEQLLEELTASHEVEIEEKRQEINDLQQQIDALDKQLRGYKHFIEVMFWFNKFLMVIQFTLLR